MLIILDSLNALLRYTTEELPSINQRHYENIPQALRDKLEQVSGELEEYLESLK